MDVKKGDQIVCTNGHVVGVVTEDLFTGKRPGTWGDCFHWLQQDKPIVGSMHVPVCDMCGASFMKGPDEGWKVLIMGWRP